MPSAPTRYWHERGGRKRGNRHYQVFTPFRRVVIGGTQPSAAARYQRSGSGQRLVGVRADPVGYFIPSRLSNRSEKLNCLV